MTIISRDQVQFFYDADRAAIRELAGPANQTLQGLSVAEITIEAGQGTTVHHHGEIEEVYYILRGSGRMHLDGHSQEVGPGDTVIIRPGVRHELQNAGQSELVMLAICAPPFSPDDTWH